MFFITLLLCVVILGGILLLLINLKTPHYRVSEKEFVRLLTLVVSGQATENDWSVVMDMPIRNSEYLEGLRQRCLVTAESTELASPHRGYLFNKEGIEQFNQILDELTGTTQKNSDS